MRVSGRIIRLHGRPDGDGFSQDLIAIGFADQGNGFNVAPRFRIDAVKCGGNENASNIEPTPDLARGVEATIWAIKANVHNDDIGIQVSGHVDGVMRCATLANDMMSVGFDGRDKIKGNQGFVLDNENASRPEMVSSDI